MADEDHQLVISYESLSGLRELQETLLNLDWTDRAEGYDRDEESYMFQRFSLLVCNTF